MGRHGQATLPIHFPVFFFPVGRSSIDLGLPGGLKVKASSESRRLPGMETEAPSPHAKKRRTDPPESKEPEEVSSSSPHPPPSINAPHSRPTSGCGSEECRGKEPPAGAGGEGEDGTDRISNLPDAVLGEIISLLPTKDGAHTQTLASRWHRLWFSAPLNIDHRGLPPGEKVLANLISRILAAHPGPARRLSVPVFHLRRRRATAEVWLRSPALDNLQELELDIGGLAVAATPELRCRPPPSASRPPSASPPSANATCRTARSRRFASPSSGSLDLNLSAFRRAHCTTSSPAALSWSACCSRAAMASTPYESTPVSIGLRVFSGVELIIEDAPSLERLLRLEPHIPMHVSVISAPKLETLGGVSDLGYKSKFSFSANVFQESHEVSFTAAVCSIKILAIDVTTLYRLDMVVDLMRCFPCLEKLYIQVVKWVVRGFMAR